MSNLSIFVDESGDFGPYQAYSPYLYGTLSRSDLLVFHSVKDLKKAVSGSI